MSNKIPVGISSTQALKHSADLQREVHARICGCIQKSGSPSCGVSDTKLWQQQGFESVGTGVYTARMIENNPELPIENEIGLGEPERRINFVQRVYARHRWLSLLEKSLTLPDLIEFHSRYKLSLMAHDQSAYQALGRLVAQTSKESLSDNAAIYFSDFMIALENIASRGNHVNVLQHVQGYLKKHLQAREKEELRQCFEFYLAGKVPLIVAKTLLTHYFHRFPDPYIANCYYMDLSLPENQMQ